MYAALSLSFVCLEVLIERYRLLLSKLHHKWDSLRGYITVFCDTFYVNIDMYLPSLQEREDVSDPMMNLATADIKARLIKNYKSSEYRAKTREKIYEIKNYVSI